jgi:hypothetical protein
MICMTIFAACIVIPMIRDPGPGGAGDVLSYIFPGIALCACIVAQTATPLALGESQVQVTGTLGGFVLVMSLAMQLYMQWDRSRTVEKSQNQGDDKL